jgi:hypothetical protein
MSFFPSTPATGARSCHESERDDLVQAVLGYQFPDAAACTQANRAAVFHPGTRGLPCLEIDGILVFAYLDHQAGTVRVTIHLDSAAQRLVRPDGTVPLRVGVEDALVFDGSGKGQDFAPALPDGPANAVEAVRRGEGRSGPSPAPGPDHRADHGN